MSTSKIIAPKGTRDLFGEESTLFTLLEKVSRDVFSQYAFEEVRTPLFESIDLFTRTLGATSDVVEKEMFAFEDRGGRSFALRPEGTAGIVRYFLENKLFVKAGVHRLFYMGPMFRAERPQAGRYRQFWQIGSEHFGDASPATDADTILMVGRILKSFGLSDFTVQVNSLGNDEGRKKYRKTLLDYLQSKKNILSEESLARMEKNPLRVLDSKVDGPKLTDAPVMKDFLTAEDKDHYQEFLSLLDSGGIKWEENTKLVRGLDYYTRTVFEFVSPHLGAQNALAAGGRYDGLVEELGGPATPGVGFALGMDRVVAVRQSEKIKLEKVETQGNGVIVAPLCQEAVEKAFQLSNQLRPEGWSVPPVAVKKKFKNILNSALELGANWIILIGPDELKDNKVTIKNLASRDQKTVDYKDVPKFLTR